MGEINETLNKLKAANLRLKIAISDTILQWPYVNECWIDQLNGEPTKPLEAHRLRQDKDK